MIPICQKPFKIELTRGEMKVTIEPVMAVDSTDATDKGLLIYMNENNLKSINKWDASAREL